MNSPPPQPPTARDRDPQPPAARDRDPQQLTARNHDPEQPTARDRDPRGRPRNARPRDALGRPLPRGQPGEEGIPDDLALAPAAALELAQRLLDDGRPFHAHEVLEASWKAAPEAERDLWQGLAQLAVGLTHVQRGNGRGAAALLRRGGQRVAGYAGGRPHGIDAAGITRWASDLVTLIEQRGLESAAADAGRLRLVPGGPADPGGPGGAVPIR